MFPPRRLVWVEERAFHLSLQPDISATILFILVAVLHLCNYQHISVAIFHPRSCCLFLLRLWSQLYPELPSSELSSLSGTNQKKFEKPGRSLNLDFYRDKKIVFVLTKRKLENPTEEVDLLLGWDKNICFYFERRFRSSNFVVEVYLSCYLKKKREKVLEKTLLGTELVLIGDKNILLFSVPCWDYFAIRRVLSF